MTDAIDENLEIARYKPFYIELEKGRKYLWCGCGRSKSQPFCDGRHKGTDYRPVMYEAHSKNEEVLFCGCKHTKTPPFCDGEHNNLIDDYPSDDPNSPVNQAIPEVARSDEPRTILNGGCYVFSSEKAELKVQENLKYCEIIGPSFGSIHQSQFHFELDDGISPVISFGERDVVLFISSGEAELNIAGKIFSADLHSGAFIKSGETFQLTAIGSTPLIFQASVGPRATSPEWPESHGNYFDETEPNRVVPLDPSQRNGMANRYFQMLVDKSVGSNFVTQFIGHIPLSKAEPHRHLYEETLIILTGEGCMWTDNLKTPVAAGDVIFLPRKQLHSLEAINKEGMLVVGTIYPGDNPAINY
jgi:CDGSH-type Zn-finger protein/mannose-6-phosphate isomerase-like protein (cupin superfamily)